jgi:fructosamine-3-kinase
LVAAVDARTQARLERLLRTDLTDTRRIGGQHGVGHYRLATADGRAAFAKLAPVPSGNFEGNEDPCGFAAEAAGLRWLAEAGTVRVPAVLAADSGCLVIEWIEADGASAEAAARFGRDLAALHVFGAGRFGAAWPGTIAGLPLPNNSGSRWAEWYAANRLLPYARIARDAGAFRAAEVRLIESAAGRSGQVAGPEEAPSRVHGDCWSGNVLWSGGRGWLIDPAAHGGHRETDMAMLALFGAPYLDRIKDAYQEIAPFADGWRGRVPLHQLHPLLVHVCLFGASYRESALAAAQAVLAA